VSTTSDNSIDETQSSDKISSRRKKRLLICADWFAPGIRAGGPIRSCMNLTTLLGSSVHVSIITSNRDLGAAEPYADVATDRWVGWKQRAAVRYCSSSVKRCIAFATTLKRNQPACVYLNSMFSFAGTLWPLFWIWVTRSPIRVTLAPRGMLKPSALQQKAWKKKPLLWLLHISGMTKHVIFHATSHEEVQEIETAFGNRSINVISNVPSMPDSDLSNHIRIPGTARLCFVGRVHPIKNLLWLLELMKRVASTCHLTVVGPMEDESYWQACIRTIKELPKNVSVEFVGVQVEDVVRQHLAESDALILPTLGENFGHAIFESLAAGTPVIISDQTIWRNLTTRNAGWDLSLDDGEGFVNAIEEVAHMTSESHHVWRAGALRTAQMFVDENDFHTLYQTMFFHDSALKSGESQE
jgi:glycosyltransferase involved in cell wall biosynthesis